MRMHGYAEAGSHRLTNTGDAFGNKYRQDVERLLGAVAGEELDLLCAPKLKPRKRDPRPRFQLSRFFTAGRPSTREGEAAR
jgi:hypothetical protein